MVTLQITVGPGPQLVCTDMSLWDIDREAVCLCETDRQTEERRGAGEVKLKHYKKIKGAWRKQIDGWI